ncbi:hypothetical protein GCM10010218_00910 [Streptomyces mashuensis]|uniref:VOC domain-containing protein n=1 Tax=Streptomyces mashuensis TaxID=33904 RepID=A0A919E6K7_9ACTN|nr:VOC family protein [Streptomyces mashuensis]GHF24257.1 hypothetical protein GCM10010218_00910 [Streptomyces mashuensis]
MTEVWEPSWAHGAEESARRQPPGTPCWTSLLARDLEAAKDFYGGLFGWTYRDTRPGRPGRPGPCARAVLGGRDVAGLAGLPPDRQSPAAWTTYLASDDADATAEWIHCSGGTVGVGPLAAADGGRMVLAGDPAGASFGVWQGPAPYGGGPGSAVWHELVTHEAAVVLKFYRALFGYEAKTTGAVDSDTVLLHVDGRPVASIRGAGAGLRQSYWVPYFAVADPEAAAVRVQELGGRVVAGAAPTAAGPATTVMDREGALFSLVRAVP